MLSSICKYKTISVLTWIHHSVWQTEALCHKVKQNVPDVFWLLSLLQMFTDVWSEWSVQIALPEACHGDQSVKLGQKDTNPLEVFIYLFILILHTLLRLIPNYWLIQLQDVRCNNCAPIQKSSLGMLLFLDKGEIIFISSFRRGQRGSTTGELEGELLKLFVSRLGNSTTDRPWEWVLGDCWAPEWQIRIPFHSVRINFMLCNELWAKALNCQALLHI